MTDENQPHRRKERTLGEGCVQTWREPVDTPDELPDEAPDGQCCWVRQLEKVFISLGNGKWVGEEKPAREGEPRAFVEIIAEQHARIPVNIITRSRSTDRGSRLLADRIGQLEHDAWEAGYEAAVRIVELEKATAVAKTLRDALADYWETQGVEREDG